MPNHLAIHAFEDLRSKNVVWIFLIKGADHFPGCGFDIPCAQIDFLNQRAMLPGELDRSLDETPGLISSDITVVVSTGVFHIQILEFLEALHALKTTVYLEPFQASVSANHPSPSS